MYVIQITEADISTSNPYTLGRPKLDVNSQSKDKVVSPAFMIASQLGAVSSSSYDASTAAAHCRHYMEVELRDGQHVRYTGWRLPTAAEVDYIVKWQNKNWDTIDKVLGGHFYYDLSGGKADTGYNTNSNSTFVRCVRDLTVEEVNALNDKTE